MSIQRQRSQHGTLALACLGALQAYKALAAAGVEMPE